MINKILEIFRESKPEAEIDENTLLFESGILDSFDLLILVNELESKFEISIPGELLIPEYFSTPLTIENLVSKLTSEQV
jgi:acyl carrier protein